MSRWEKVLLFIPTYGIILIYFIVYFQNRDNKSLITKKFVIVCLISIITMIIGSIIFDLILQLINTEVNLWNSLIYMVLNGIVLDTIYIIYRTKTITKNDSKIDKL